MLDSLPTIGVLQNAAILARAWWESATMSEADRCDVLQLRRSTLVAWASCSSTEARMQPRFVSSQGRHPVRGSVLTLIVLQA